jgi:hypothetical protein
MKRSPSALLIVLSLLCFAAVLVWALYDHAPRKETLLWLERPLSLEVRNLTLRETLDTLCEVEGCEWRVQGPRIVVTRAR